MIKTNLKDMPVITIHIHQPDKEALKRIADKQGMQLATYCRMILLRELNKERSNG